MYLLLILEKIPPTDWPSGTAPYFFSFCLHLLHSGCLVILLVLLLQLWRYARDNLSQNDPQLRIRNISLCLCFYLKDHLLYSFQACQIAFG